MGTCLKDTPLRNMIFEKENGPPLKFKNDDWCYNLHYKYFIPNPCRKSV